MWKETSLSVSVTPGDETMKNLLRICVTRFSELVRGDDTFASPARCHYRRRISLASILGVLGVLISNANAQAALSTSHGRNYVEANVAAYDLPDPLLGKDGRRVTDAHSWTAARRAGNVGGL